MKVIYKEFPNTLQLTILKKVHQKVQIFQYEYRGINNSSIHSLNIEPTILIKLKQKIEKVTNDQKYGRVFGNRFKKFAIFARGSKTFTDLIRKPFKL